MTWCHWKAGSSTRRLTRFLFSTWATSHCQAASRLSGRWADLSPSANGTRGRHMSARLPQKTKTKKKSPTNTGQAYILIYRLSTAFGLQTSTGDGAGASSTDLYTGGERFWGSPTEGERFWGSPTGEERSLLLSLNLWLFLSIALSSLLRRTVGALLSLEFGLNELFSLKDRAPKLVAWLSFLL